MTTSKTLVIGAGPAGLTTAYALAKKGQIVTVLEADPVHVGGISKTMSYKGFRFDIGGHRFFSKSEVIERLWTEILPNDMLERPRSSRILYRGKFFSYPLKPVEALFKLGVLNSILCALSYLRAVALPVRNPKTFEDWVGNQFGKRLFSIFFKTYTEKVWGMSCKEISADWASQRIQGLSLFKALTSALTLAPRKKSRVIKTLINSFRYPRLGPGMMWDECARKMEALGGELKRGRRLSGLTFDAESAEWLVTSTRADGQQEAERAHNVVSSAPLRELAAALKPHLSEESLKAAAALRYRDFITVALILKERHVFDDNWLYIHDKSVKVGRIQNFKSWSPELVPDTEFCCYGLEYFCFEGDGLWTAHDQDLVAMAAAELVRLGLASAGDITDGCVIRQPKAYPVYDEHYATHVETIRRELEAKFSSLHLVGRNGMHKYNNQDHAMMTGLLCAENIMAGRSKFDLWQVNQDAGYLETGTDSSPLAAIELRLTPQKVKTSAA